MVYMHWICTSSVTGPMENHHGNNPSIFVFNWTNIVPLQSWSKGPLAAPWPGIWLQRIMTSNCTLVCN